MKYKIVNSALGKPGTEWKPGPQYTPQWIEKAIRKGHIAESTFDPPKGAKTETTKPTKGKP